MKSSVAVSLLMIAVTVGIGWIDSKRLISARDKRAALAARAVELGLASTNGTERIQRPDRETEARRFAADYLAFILKEKIRFQIDTPEDEDFIHRWDALQERTATLDAKQLGTLIEELRAADDLEEDVIRSLIGDIGFYMARLDPRATLRLFDEPPRPSDTLAEQLLGSSLGLLAKTDPSAAIDWLRENSVNHADLINDRSKMYILKELAEMDPILAFHWIDKLDLTNAAEGIWTVAAHAQTPEQQTAVLSALRLHLDSVQDKNDRDRMLETALVGLISNAAKQGFEPASRWIETANLKDEEIRSIHQSLESSIQPGDRSQWIDWIGQRFPEESSKSGIRGIFRSWTANDHRAAAEWIGSAPQGPLRDHSIHAFSAAVAPYEPETAAQWALTLAPGDAREGTLREIHRNWIKSDPAAAAAFAAEHGLK